MLREQLFLEVDKEVIPAIKEFIKIPNKSRCFEPNWRNCPKQKQAMNFCLAWF